MKITIKKALAAKGCYDVIVNNCPILRATKKEAKAEAKRLARIVGSSVEAVPSKRYKQSVTISKHGKGVIKGWRWGQAI